MICKQIKVNVKPGQVDQYLATQRIWNKETAKCPGYVREFTGQSPNEPNIIHVHIYWQTRADLERFMTEQHNRIAAIAQADAHYDSIEVTIIDGIE